MKPFEPLEPQEYDARSIADDLRAIREAEGNFDNQPMTPEERRAGFIVFVVPILLIALLAIAWWIAS